MKSSEISYGFLLSFLITLLLLRFWQLPAYPLLLLVALGSVAGASIGWSSYFHSRKIGIIGVMTLGMLLAFLVAARAVHVTNPDDIESFALNTPVTISGWISEPPDVRPTMTKLTVSITELSDANGTYTVKGKTLFNDINAWPELHYGDHVTITGKLQKPEIIDGFDYPHYLELRGIRTVITRGKVILTPPTGPQPPSARTWRLIGMLSALRTTVEDQIGLVLPEPHASLLAGLLTGTRRGLSEKLSDNFRRAGITHIVAVSGYNVTIILVLLGSMLFWLPIRKRFLPLSAAAVLFCVFVGAGAPVLRATIMGILGLLAISAERIAITRLLILWTAFLMLLWNPLMLWYDASFQLSFLAVIGLSELSPWLKPLFKKVPDTLAIRESLVATVAAQIATIPLSILLFRQFSLIAPVSNILVAPLIPLSMLLGSIATGLSFIYQPLGLFVGAFAWFTLELILKIGTICGSLPIASITF